MDEAINNLLLDELYEAHGIFDNIISEIQENDINYSYEQDVMKENVSYHASYNAILRMDKSMKEYSVLVEENSDFFSYEKKLIVKYIMLYVTSIIIIKVFSKTLSSDKINEIWYALIGMVLGATNATIIDKNVNNYRYGNKENREFMMKLSSLKDEYEENFETARKEIHNIFLLNRDLENKIPPVKKYKKK